MRIRIRVFLPLAVAVLVAACFLLAAALVGGAVRGSLTTVPGLTAQRAGEAAVRVVFLAGVAATALVGLVAAVVARMIAEPLNHVREAAERLGDSQMEGGSGTPVAEIQDVARGISTAAEDLRERYARVQQERSALAGLVEAVSEGIIQLDAEGRVLRVNQAARELLGLPEETTGQPVGALIRHRDARVLLERAVQGESVDPSEVPVDGRRLLIAMRPQPDGGTVATVVDLTTLRRLETVRQDFVANASHELKTPLTSIRGYAETLVDAELSDAQRADFLATIARNADRLQRLVDDLLDLSRIEAGRWQPDLETVDVRQVAEASWQVFEGQAHDRGVAFRLEEGDEIRARADRRALEQVFTNLFDNALRYTGEGGRITVSVRSQDGPLPESWAVGREPTTPGATVRQPGSWVIADVADTGTGIPRELLPRIFERFYRVDPARSREEGGTGLGLAIVRHMMETMGGAVEARSELGKGTVLRLWLPRAPEASTQPRPHPGP